MRLQSRHVILAVAVCLHVCTRSLTEGVPNDATGKNSNESLCSYDTFHCYNETEAGHHCIPRSWVCDGENDCAFGEDERADCNQRGCNTGEFHCHAGVPYCISESYVCDKHEDCSDGSDESVQECLNHKRGTHTRGQSVDQQFKCLPNQYNCPNSQRCIPFNKVCDYHVDCLENGADEGRHCANYGCKQKKCEFDCRETEKGPQCYCEDGFQPVGDVCKDYNECDFDGFCDQKCENTNGSYICSCVADYTLGSGSQRGRCTADNSDQKKLLVTNYDSLLFFGLTEKSLRKPPENLTASEDRITSVDFSVRNNSACWMAYNKDTAEPELQCCNVENKKERWTVSTQFKLSSVHQIVIDWVSGNWYFVDDKRDRIFLCTSNGQYCLTVIYHGISRPKSIAIDSSRGYIFFADWSSNQKLGRAYLDGSNAVNLVTKKIVHPSVITLDYANKHVYWADAFLNLITRVNYDGTNRRTVFEDRYIKPHHGLTLFENYLYISNVKLRNHSVVRVHRYDRTEAPVIIQRGLIKPGALQVFHQARQPNYDSNICHLKNCSQICIPRPNVNDTIIATCTCQAGYGLVGDTKCEKNIPKRFLIYANAQQGSIRGISIDKNVKHDVIEPILNLNRPIALAYHAEEDMVYFSDVSMMRISRRNINSHGDATVFLDSGVTSCEGLAVDWVGRNLYWTDDGHQIINVVKLDNTSMVHTVVEKTNHPRSVVIDPNEGYMYWIDLFWRPPETITAKIEKARLDGSDRKDLVTENIRWPNSLTLDRVNHRLYWTDAFSDTIESISTDGQDRKIEKQLNESIGQGGPHPYHHPYGVAVHDGIFYWTESLKGLVDTGTRNTTFHLHNDSTPLFDLILFDKDGQTTNPGMLCAKNNGGCSDLCLSVPGGKVCACANGRQLKNDNLTCEDIPDYKPPPVCDSNFKFQCANNECINLRFKCDGDYDCSDRSDEDMSEHGVCSNTTCPDESMFTCSNKRCIYAQFVCDGESDCIDGTDEHVNICHSGRECPVNYTMCNSTFRCIPNNWLCDHDKDCADGSDENESCEYSETCEPGEIKCLSGRCIPYMYRCDHEYDCDDLTDEWDCSDWCDNEREFKCKNSSVCLPLVYRCDNERNCLDGSDEENCARKHYCDESHEFQCNTGSCIAKIWHCDGDKDCQDGSDESNCTHGKPDRKCHPSQFPCTDGLRCIPMAWKCDMDNDCKDGSDEKECKYNSPCEPPKFSCPNNNNTCLDVEKLCDGTPDCRDGYDEKGLCDFDMCINNDCSHLCHKSPDGFACSCPENMKLSSNNKICIPVDVCEKWGICSQKCVNTPDGHQCLCYPGYAMDNDRYSCKPVDPVPTYIIYSNRHEIRRYELGTKNYFSLISGLRNTIALDFHYERKWIFWTDVVDDKIYRGQMISNTITDIKPIIDVGLATTEGLAIDWIADNIYWVESNLDQIEVAKLDGTNRSTLVAGNMISPRAIVLDPREGLLFWTDWDDQYPRIEVCSMSGENRKVIYDITKVPGGGWPNGLTIDYEAKRIYWVDARSDSVHTITYEGDDHRRIVHNHDALAHPFALTLFEHYVYWTDWRTNSLVRANKFNGSDVLTIQRTNTQPFDVQVFHPKRQPHAPNPCENNGGCSHLCLIGRNNTSVCKCPHRMKLDKTNTTCKEDNKFLLFVKENEIRGVDLNNAHFNVIPSITLPFVENATAIDYDSEGHKLYWTDRKRNVICSAFINGTGVETIIDSGISNPEGFAIDWLSKNMYFSSYDDQKASISVAKLNGAYRTEITTNLSPTINLSKPNSLAVHPKKGLMFWSDLGGEKHRIIRADMDGSNPTVIVGDAKNPASLTIDVTEERLYWISRDENTIWVCNLDGSEVKELDKTDWSIESPISMTIYGDTIYVANSTNILKFDTHTKNQKAILMRDNTPHVYAMQVYDPNERKGGSNGCSNMKCEQMCLPNSNNKGICKCTAGFTVENNTCRGIDSFLLYSTVTEIRGFSLEDLNSEALAPISKISLAASVDFYSGNGDDFIFWVDSNARVISRIKRDLTARETVVEDRINGIEGIAVDWIAGNIYWTDRGHDTIEVSRLNGSNRYVVMHGNMEKPKAIVVHPLQGYVFFSDWGSSPKIVRARLDGSEREDWITENIQTPYGLTIDYTSNTLYWCDKGLNVIERVDIQSKERIVVYRNLTDCVALSVLGDYIYWADSTSEGGSGAIKRARKNGKDVTILRKNISKQLKDIKVFDKSIQIGTNICQGTRHGCEQLCLYRGNGNYSCACSHGKLANDSKSCEEYTEFLLFSEVTSLQSIQLKSHSDPNAPTKPISNSTSMKNVIGLAFDHSTKRIFYSDIQIGNIQSVWYNGTYIEEIVNGVGAAEGLAFDERSKDLYWTSYTNSSISKINLSAKPGDRTTKVLIQLTGEDHPRAIVIDVCSNKMFWTNWNDKKPSIQKSSLEGFRVESIITTNIRTPNGLTIDHRGQKLYWTDARLDKIERCDFNGKNRYTIVTEIPQHSFGIAVSGDYIYWTDWMLRAILRANKIDGTGLTWLKKGIKRQPMGIIAVASDTNDCTTNLCLTNVNKTSLCDELCSVTALGEVECGCVKGHKLLPDNWRCADESLDCGVNDFVCDFKKRCIPITKTCNNISDCLDASDESRVLCKGARECPVGFFTCNKTGRCITIDKICDGKSDCGQDDESDESKCPCVSEDQFQCAVGLCINSKYRCDRDSDCPDHSDEIGCNLSCSELEIDGEFLEGLVSCNTTSACIYPSWKCDGSNDCWDNSDEIGCEKKDEKQCQNNAFTCKSGSCIPPQWQCDKDNDCGDNTDEENCTYHCEENQFQCKDHNCIPSTWQCDSHPDCPDSSDETDDCENRTCGPDKFRCKSGRCIPLTWMCDADKDCDDGADESRPHAQCPEASTCKEDEFRCNNSRCIRLAFFCDLDNDCGDGSDEPPSCVHHACAPNEFQCSDNRYCIPHVGRCNGLFDCPDHSDEMKCDVSPCGNVTQFQCRNHVCINEELVCNGHNDCGDESDEPEECNVNECYVHNGTHMCTQKCRDKKIGYECDCRDGFELLSDNRTCIDVNECNRTYPCSQYCVNTVGSYICGCAENYILTADKKKCKVKDSPKPYLLVSSRYYIRKVPFPYGESKILHDRLHNSVAVDYDWKEGYIYWSDITSANSSINRMPMNSSQPPKTEVLHSTTVRNPDGLAVDWVGRNLYWSDKTTDTIEVSKLNGAYRKVLLREGLQEPRGLEVFPARGFLYFTDWGDSPHISRMWMDGTNRQTVIKDNLAWPNALTIDYVTEKIFWADGSLDYIAMANLDGSGRRIVVSDNKLVPHVFALATFESYIFWSDWEKTAVFYADKFSGKNVQMLAKMTHRPMDIQVVHQYRQVPGQNDSDYSPCANNNGCSHLCLLKPTPYSQLSRIEAVCGCPENHYLGTDKKTCISNCTHAQFLCEKSSKCIPKWWVCDQHKDCDDGTDEPANCTQYFCDQPGLFQCKNATSKDDCFVPTVICEGTKQCSDGSDELDCELYPCMEHQFKCHDSNVCISKTLQCNGKNECKSGEDERDCPKSECNQNQFTCGNGRCVPYVWRCDHDNDCGDASDEPANCTHLECKGDHTKCLVSGRCIPDAWKCDGDPDCGENDDTDEKYEECHLRTCDPTYFKCDNGHCIPGRWQCDYYDDCRDGSDERKCTPRNCSEAEVKCDNGKCIRENLKCDGEVHCEDGSDESNCGNKTCDPQNEFKCGKVVHCIPKSWQCDGDIDCADGTDELDCKRECTRGEFRCNNSQCVPDQWQCDGDYDCTDNSDETPEMCKSFKCSAGRFKCDNDICIWGSMVCDGHEDCANGTDEKNCRRCEPGEFQCSRRHQCIPYNLMCDGSYHCEDKSDEETLYCETVKKGLKCPANNPGQCEQRCRQLKFGIKCECKDGFSLNRDGFRCDAINPCEKWGMCSQKCTFEQATSHHHCYCQTGFKRVFGTCAAEGRPPQVLIAEKTKVLQSPTTVDMTNTNTSVAKLLDLPSVEAKDNSVIVAMDVDTTGTDLIAFVVTETNNMSFVTKNTLKVSGGKRVTREIKNRDQDALWFGHAKIKDISLDWIFRRIYYIDGTTKSIQLRGYSGKNQVHIIDGGLDEPSALAVDPHSGKIFWTEQGSWPKIGSANMDGSDRKVLVKDELDWPNGIAVDYENGWVYWCDTKKQTVETVSVDGKGRTIVHRFEEEQPYKIEVFEDYLYVQMYKSHHLLKLHKFGRQTNQSPAKLQPVYTGLELVNAIVIIQDYKMNKNLTNNCSGNGGQKCTSGLCFNKPNSEDGFICKCPKHSKMKDNKCDFKDPCQDYCQNNGNCSLNVYQEPKCSCPLGFDGDRCDKDICQNYCLNKGNCSKPDAYNSEPSCSCSHGYKGRRCDQYICTNYCHNGGICYVEGTEAKCKCRLQYSGDRCQKKLASSVCMSHCVKTNTLSCAVKDGQPNCVCKNGFKGKQCEHCDDLFCYNSGTCIKNSDNKPTCLCQKHYDPRVECREHTCDYKCKNDLWLGTCRCIGKCPGPECREDVDRLCNNYCKNGGVCSVVSGIPKCKCNMAYSGDQCDVCQCKNGGSCFHTRDGLYRCRCKENFTGTFCETTVSQPVSSPPHTPLNPLYIIIPAIILVVVMLLILAVVFYKRKQRKEQYGHKRMKEPNRMDVKNPMYLRHEEEADERDPLGNNPIFRGDASTNFANPMYDVYNTSESMQMLLNQEIPQDCEENQLLEGGTNVRYFGTSDLPLKHTSKA